MLDLHVVFLLLAAAFAKADYTCMCNYNVELEVHNGMSDSSTVIGSLYEFDCKEQLSADQGWTSIAFEHKLGYVKTGPNIESQVCPGDPPEMDKIYKATTVDAIYTTTTPLSTITLKTTTTSTEPSKNPPTMTTTMLSQTSTPPATTTAFITTTAASTATTSSIVKSTNPTTTTFTTTPMPLTTIRQTTTAPTHTSTRSISTRPPSTTSFTLVSTSKPAATVHTVIQGNTSLCPVALKSFTAHDGGMLTQYDNKCYEVVPHRQSWMYAERDCKGKGGNLVQIKSAEEQAFLVKYLNTHYNHNIWIGLHDHNHEGHFEWDADPNSNPPVYSNWEPGFSTHHQNQDCVYLRPQNNGYWYDGECSGGSGGFRFTPHAYVCQYETDPTALLHGTVNPHGDGDTHLCPSSVQHHASRYHGILGHYKNSCYEVLPRFKVTWSHGEQSCRQRGGHLAHISSADEQNFIQDFMTNHLPDHAAWIGLNDKVNENHFVWTSGHPVTYTNWVNGHEGNFVSHHKEDCALFIPYQKGQWDDLPCGQSNLLFGDVGETHPIICQFDVTGPSIIG